MSDEPPEVPKLIVTPPFGLLDVNPQLQIHPGPPERVRCVVKGCKWFLRPPSRGTFRGDVCPDHQVRCHRSGTYSYADVRRNTIIDPDLVTRVVRSPHKFESHRLGGENSEDMAVLSTFVSLMRARHLNVVARYITGLEIDDEPQLYLWSLSVSDDTLKPFDLLQAARSRFEPHLVPVVKASAETSRPATEPDVILYLPGVYIIAIEVKFGSSNTFVASGTRRTPHSLTREELLDQYDDPELAILDREKARVTDIVYHQCWRNTVMAEWMSRRAPPGTKAYFCNLTRKHYENDSFNHFARMVRPEFIDRVRHVHWEELFVIAGLAGCRLRGLRRYLATKTLNLRRAFDLGFF